MRYEYHTRHDNVSPATRWLMYALAASWVALLTIALGPALSQAALCYLNQIIFTLRGQS